MVERHGDIMMVMPDTVAVADVSVVYPSSADMQLGLSRRRHATGASARGRWGANDLEPMLPVEAFRRLGKPAMVCSMA
jgi:hypothetical protein